MAEQDYIIRMEGISKYFPGVVANENVSISVKKGEIYAILGENGAGKSTLMSMLFGMYEPDAGEIYIRGQKVNITSPLKANELNIGMVHQHFTLVSEYTVAENIVMGMEPVKKVLGIIPGIDMEKANKDIAELSKRYGLDVNPTDVIKNLNVSSQQRVEILKMLYREAEILILDEPTAVLTPQEIRALLEIIKGLRDKGKTIILITHKLEEIKQIADRCAILNKGRLIDVRNVADTSTKEMANLMVGREVSFSTEKKPANFGREVLRVENLVVRNTNKFPVVNDVSFSIREGEIFAIAGVAGNGQVEIADTIAGLTKASGGKISYYGEDITNVSVRERVEKGITYVPEDRQNYGLVLDFDTNNNTVLKDYYRQDYQKSSSILDFDKIKKHGRELINEYDIRGAEDGSKAVRSLSGGNQQKVIVAREFTLSSKLMIFVQPTRGLDIGAIEFIRKKIVKEREAGKAILLVSLELDEIMDIADTIAAIYGGKLQTIAPAGELTANMVGEFMMGVHSGEVKADEE